MSLKSKITGPVIEATNSMIAGDKITIEVASKIMQHLNVSIDNTELDMVRQIGDKIHLWESMYGGNDKTLYTLGLRHALDIIKGELATDNNGFNDKPYVEGQEFKLDEVVEDI